MASGFCFVSCAYLARIFFVYSSVLFHAKIMAVDMVFVLMRQHVSNTLPEIGLRKICDWDKVSLLRHADAIEFFTASSRHGCVFVFLSADAGGVG